MILTLLQYNIITVLFVVVGLILFGLEITHRDVAGNFDTSKVTIGLLVFFVGIVMALVSGVVMK